MGLFSRLFAPYPTPAPKPKPKPAPQPSPMELRAEAFAEKISQGITQEMLDADTDGALRQRVVEQIDAEADSIADEDEREEFRLAAQKAWNARYDENGQILEWNRTAVEFDYYADSPRIVMMYPHADVCRRYHCLTGGLQILEKATCKPLTPEFQHLDFLLVGYEDAIRKIYYDIDERHKNPQMQHSMRAFEAWLESIRQANPGVKRYEFKYGLHMNMNLALSLNEEFKAATGYRKLDVFVFATEEEVAEVARLREKYGAVREQLVALQLKYGVTDHAIDMIRYEKSYGAYYIIDPLTNEERKSEELERWHHFYVDFLAHDPLEISGWHEKEITR